MWQVQGGDGQQHDEAVQVRRGLCHHHQGGEHWPAAKGLPWPGRVLPDAPAPGASDVDVQNESQVCSRISS